MKSLQRSPDTTNLKSAAKKHFGKISECLLTIADLCVSVAVLIFPYLVLFTNFSEEVKRYIIAINVIADCFSLMRMFSRLPGCGIYIFMMKRVTISIARFLSTYFWHFFGYAIAFHIIMPQDDGAFSTMHDSSIKVLTMLMGEYDFADNFVETNTFWLSKVIFVVFVLDMSIVLMNLVIGLAVNDVDSIKRESNVQ